MSNLKTLKDLRGLPRYGFKTRKYSIEEDDLRQAAREWIKELENYYLGGYTFGDKWYSSDEGIDLAVGWIKHFFNLEDE